MSASGEITETRLRPTICEAIERAAASLDITGVRALRVLLHAGVSAYWPLIKAAPDGQIRAYERIVNALRSRWATREPVAAAAYSAAGLSDTALAEPAPTEGNPAASVFREMDCEVADFLRLCADRSGAQWLEPVEAIASYTVSVLQGTVLRWLSDSDDETMLVVLDDLVSSLSTKAVEV
ncbi:TetR family transcriptional regulator [Nocardia panacis]|uniref:TetR family transcriptional regulator n=1 Tax=Nocardia panacis TaxID=2340916 RepID=A0A3A4KD45_9NOCA|nr:TetR family transcriptional regulator [Nocardia panacis]RJO80008.1 TetR family transcriptional regulator [Nocardia panacis]